MRDKFIDGGPKIEIENRYNKCYDKATDRKS